MLLQKGGQSLLELLHLLLSGLVYHTGHGGLFGSLFLTPGLGQSQVGTNSGVYLVHCAMP